MSNENINEINVNEINVNEINVNEINVNEINNNDENEDIDLDELETLLFSNTNNNTDKVNYSIYVSNTELNNGFFNFRTINEAIDYIININEHEYEKQYQINLLPGIYYESFTIPSYIHIKGSGKDITSINLSKENEFICMCSDTSLSDLTINFDNVLDLDNVILLDVNSRILDSKLESQKKKYY